MHPNPLQDWIFDLDNTLYDPACSVFPQIHARMEDYIARHFSVSAEMAAKKRDDYFHRYGTSLRGLMLEEKIDPDHFLDFVHDIDYRAITAAPELKTLIDNLQGRKIIFTNADNRHAFRVLNALGLEYCFEAIFDIADGDYICKPNPEPYRFLLEKFGLKPENCAMIDDMENNLKTAHHMGMKTIWLRHEAAWQRRPPKAAHHYPHCHIAIESLVPFFQTLQDKAA